MAQLIREEVKLPDNCPRSNFVFLGFPFTPVLPADTYRRIVKEVQEELSVRMWYFLDEITTDELLRKIWRAILRSNLCIFDISEGNPNVAFELGLSVSQFKPCITFLKTGSSNPLGKADLGYSERVEYNDEHELKSKIRELVLTKAPMFKAAKDISYEAFESNDGVTREQIENYTLQILRKIFKEKSISTAQIKTIVGNDVIAKRIIAKLKDKKVINIIGQTKGAKFVFSNTWVYEDHEVMGQEWDI